jgi:hypothetical protein
MSAKAKLAILASTVLLAAIVLWQSGVLSRKPLAREEMQAAITSQAQQMLDAMSKGDFQAWADLTLPAAIEQSGGREKWIESMKAFLKLNEDIGGRIGFVKADDSASISEYGSVHYATVLYESELIIQNTTSVEKSVLIAVSRDGGKKWKFAVGSHNRNRVKATLPDFPDEIPLPTREELKPRVTRMDPIARKRPKAVPKDETKPLSSEEMTTRLKTQVQEMFDAMVKGDLKPWEDRTLPEAIEKHGGRDKWLNAMKENLRLRQQVGITIDSIKAGDITATKSGNPECFGVINYEVASTFEGKQNVRKGSLVGASTDGG